MLGEFANRYLEKNTKIRAFSDPSGCFIINDSTCKVNGRHLLQIFTGQTSNIDKKEIIDGHRSAGKYFKYCSSKHTIKINILVILPHSCIKISG